MAQEQPAPFPDTAHFLDAANDSARHFRAVYTTYLMIASYIIFTIVSTEDELLFRNGNVQMPIIDIGVSIKRFFIIAPLILFFLHLNVLIQAVFLSTKVRRYTSVLNDDRHTPAFYNKGRNAPGLLFPVPLAHFLVADDQQKDAQWILWVVVVFTSIVLLPLAILIYAEIHFLTYQSELITWMHRIAIGLDIILLWCLWPRIIAPDKGLKEYWRQSSRKRRAAKFASVATGLFVLVIADIPGGTMENFIFPNALHDWRELLGRRYQLEERILVQEEPHPKILETQLACKFQNLAGPACQARIEPGSLIWCQHAKPLLLQRRAFRGANLHKAVLCEANLHETKLQGADLRYAELQSADLSYAELQGADLRYASLQGADLRSTELQGADLSYAELQGADLRSTELQGADLSYAELQGVDLRSAALQGADLRYAALQGADLRSATLQGAYLISASLQGANLRFTELQGADLRYASLEDAYLISAALQGANLSSASLQGADLRSASLQGAGLRSASLQGADLSEASLQGADLSEASLQGADLSEASLQGADLSSASLQGADLYSAELQGVDLSFTELQGVDLSYTELQGADLRGAELQGADLYSASLQGADLYSAALQGTDLGFAELQGADLSYAVLQGADLSYTELQGADLRWAYLVGSDLSYANLNLADLRDVDLESKPDQEQLQKAITIIKSIKQQERRDQALELVKRAETEEATIAPYSIKDAIFSEGSALYRRLQEPENRELLQTGHFTQTKEDDYDTKLAAYLIDSLSCGDEDSYVAEGIIRYRILVGENRKLTSIFAGNLNLDSKFVKKLNRGSKVSSLLCQGIKKHLYRLSEEERTELRAIFAESANQ